MEAAVRLQLLELTRGDPAVHLLRDGHEPHLAAQQVHGQLPVSGRRAQHPHHGLPPGEHLDRERPGEGAVDKVVLIGLAVVVAPFTVLVIIGRVIGFF
ncbi:hypothetical protein [Kocuria salsicia]|uniref:hypothetical protein n=1 Tax=Kocuria salsicia TaxID=664639 RepID=UPI001FD46E3E|nr:hypothetical protein [Kocuria salsicia]